MTDRNRHLEETQLRQIQFSGLAITSFGKGALYSESKDGNDSQRQSGFELTWRYKGLIDADDLEQVDHE